VEAEIFKRIHCELTLQPTVRNDVVTASDTIILPVILDIISDILCYSDGLDFGCDNSKQLRVAFALDCRARVASTGE
jgi:hypothetical protein